jgi:hypothetical protein
MGLVATIIVTLVLVLGLGLLIFKLLRRNQKAVPDMADRQAARHDQAVAMDDQGQPVMESQEADDAAPPDNGAFEGVLDEQLKDLRG